MLFPNITFDVWEGYKMPDIPTKLLVVDDEATTRLLMTRIFTDLGHSVRSAADGFSALAEIRQEIPDIVLSDLNMPGMSGFELISVVRRRFPTLPIIAMSGAFSGNGMQPGVAADAFYEKASNLKTLLEVVEAINRQGKPPTRHIDTTAPIWIQTNGCDSSGTACITIACPECLRTFPQVLGTGNCLVHTTDCAHCHSLIHYAIVQPTDPASPQAFQRKPNSGTHVDSYLQTSAAS